MILNIYDLASEELDRFINPSCDKFASVLKNLNPFGNDTDNEETVSISIEINFVVICPDSIYLSFPDGNAATISVSSDKYHKIEVL